VGFNFSICSSCPRLTNLRKKCLEGTIDHFSAALALFGKDPAEFYPGISVRIGRFGASDADLQFQEVVEGNVIHCLREAMQQILSKFTLKPIRFEGIQRIESPQYPIEALREILLNAMVHRRYQSGVHVQIRVYADLIICWNDGPLPHELSLEKLLGFHSSYPRNPLIADACFKAGYIDSWGRGIKKITEACFAADLPAPAFEEAEGGMRVTLFAARERLESGLESRSESESESKQPQCEAGNSSTEGGNEPKAGESDTQGLESGPEWGPESILVRTLEALKAGPLAKSQIADALGHQSISSKLNQRIREMLEAKLVELTIPGKPTSRLQQYRLTAKGQQVISNQKGSTND
jgi:ATP-dependent DNA helicase RecG